MSGSGTGLRLCANLGWMFKEAPFLERFALAAQAGFRGVELAFDQYEHTEQEVAEACKAAGVSCQLLNTPKGAWEAGERGLAAVPGRESDFQAALGQALSYCRALGCPRIHVMTGVLTPGVALDEHEATLLRNLEAAAKPAQEAGVTLMLEPISAPAIPGYFLGTIPRAVSLMQRMGNPAHVRLQLDFYHLQLTSGNIAATLREHAALIDHVQISGVPGRNEPDEQNEINYPFLFDVLARELGYKQWVGLEYNPRGGTVAGLAWAKPFLGGQ